MNSLKNKVALIKGSARGLGKTIAERYAAMGADIVVNYSRDKASAAETVSNTKEMIDRLASLSAFNRIEEPIDTVRVVLFLASDEAKRINAQSNGVSGGMV